jgi:hypothetical protein
MTMATIVPSGRVNGGSASMIGRATRMVLLTQSKNAEARVDGSGVESLQSSPAVVLREAMAYELLWPSKARAWELERYHWRILSNWMGGGLY